MAEDLRLRDVDEADLETLYEQQLDQEAIRRSTVPARDHEAFLHHWRTRILAEPTVFVQAVTVDGDLAGSIVSWWAQPDRRFVGYWFDRRYWGRGIGTRAVRRFLEMDSVRPLYADPYVGNTASVRLLEKCGFRRDGSIWNDDTEYALMVLEPDDQHRTTYEESHGGEQMA